MIKIRKLFEISKIKKLKLDNKYKKALNELLLSLEDWGHENPETLDIFLNEIKQFIEKDKIYSNDLKKLIVYLIGKNQVSDYAWEVEAIYSLINLFEIFGDDAHLEEIFTCISEYFEKIQF